MLSLAAQVIFTIKEFLTVTDYSFLSQLCNLEFQEHTPVPLK